MTDVPCIFKCAFMSACSVARGCDVSVAKCNFYLAHPPRCSGKACKRYVACLMCKCATECWAFPVCDGSLMRSISISVSLMSL